MKIVGFVGMPGSGKSEASEVAKSMGLRVVIMGDIIRQDAARLGLEPTDENLGKVGSALREKEGPDIIARRSLDAARRSGQDLAIIDGIRSKAEVDYFRSHSDGFKLVEIWTPSEARRMRLASRRRPDDGAASPASLKRREGREMGWGMGEAIEAADVRICNEGSIEDLRSSVRELLRLFSERSIGDQGPRLDP